MLKRAWLGDEDARRRYSDLRTEYHAVIKSRRLKYREEEEALMIRRAEHLPYSYIKRTKGFQVCQADNLTIKTHFLKLLYDPEASVPRVDCDLPLTFDQWLMNAPFVPQEVETIIKRLPPRKSSGLDGIFYEHWKSAAHLLAPLVAELFNKVLEEGKIPKSWHNSRLLLLFKGKPSDPKDCMDQFRGIACESTLKKIFFKGVINRIEPVVEQALPPQQFGFRRGRGTRDAIHVVMSEIERRLINPGHLYAIFIDCKKAFDRAPRDLMTQGFKDAGVNGPILKVIESFFHEDKLKIASGNGVHVDVAQNRGTPQGDPLSCIAFTLLLADLPQKVIDEFNHGLVVMFADDIIIAHVNKLIVQQMLDLVGEYLARKGLELNPAKTQVMKFRKGGPLAGRDKIYWKGECLQVAKTAKYLGIRLQPTGTTFTYHVEEVSCRVMSKMYAEIGDPSRLSVTTAIKLFYIKAVPMLTYGLDRLWNHLTVRNFEVLEKCFTLYLKRVLRVPRSSPSRLVYVLAGLYAPLCEELRCKMRSENTASFLSFTSEWRTRFQEAQRHLQADPIMARRDIWAGPQSEKRHVYTRYLVHGYHHHICINKGYHLPKVDCECRFCGQLCPWDHALACPSRLVLSELAKL